MSAARCARAALVATALAGTALATRALAAQPTAADEMVKAKAPSLADFFRVDASLPDVPAATAIGVDPSKAGTPGTARALAMSFAGFSDDGGKLRLPEQFAVEFAPRLVFAGRGLNAAAFRRDIAYSTLRLSAATARIDTTGATRIAVGIRTNLVDQSDPRANRTFSDSVSALLLRWSQRYANLRQYVVGDRFVDDTAAFFAKPEPKPAGSAAAGAGSVPPKVDTALVRLQHAVTATHDSLVALKRRFDDASWNATRVELAYALGGATLDAAGRSPRAESHAAWAGVTYRVSRYGAANVVARYERVRDTAESGAPFAGQGVGAARLILGSQRARVFGEYQYTHRSDALGRVWAGGGELRLTADVWLRLSTGITQPVGEAKGRLVTLFKIQASPSVMEPKVTSTKAPDAAPANAPAKPAP